MTSNHGKHKQTTVVSPRGTTIRDSLFRPLGRNPGVYETHAGYLAAASKTRPLVTNVALSGMVEYSVFGKKLLEHRTTFNIEYFRG